MLNSILHYLEISALYLAAQLQAVLAYPVSTNQRIFWLYLLSAIALAVVAFAGRAREESGGMSSRQPFSVGAFVRFLFPAEIWRHRSTWLDIRYFFFHQIFRVALYSTFLTAVLNAVYALVTGGAGLSAAGNQPVDPGTAGFAVSLLFMVVVIGFVDFVSYAIHYLQHRVPVLWEFHRVHHSLEVMQPFSNYREHPIDNIAYAAATGVAYGLLMGVASNLFGFVPTMPQLIGIPLLMFAFNILGYNLRHSHVWLRWPGRWSMAFASPAHHQVHHSCHPDHVDRNFAFIFPIWDVLFGTYAMPETNRDVRFGIAGERDEYRSCLGLYFDPFRRLWTNHFGSAGTPGEADRLAPREGGP